MKRWKMGKIKIPTILGLLILTLSLPAATLLVNRRQIFKLGAKLEFPPQEVNVTNITDSSFTVIWTTSEPTTGFVSWGESENKLDKTQQSEMESKSYLHSSTISGLSPNKKYYFKINSNGNFYSNNDKAWETKTAPTKTTMSPSGNIKIGGKVITASGEEAAEILILVKIPGASLISTVTSQNGNWIISLDTVANENLTNYMKLSPEDKATITALAGPKGVATAEIYLKIGQDIPPMILGKNYNFSDQPKADETQSIKSEITAPEEISKTPKFETEKTENVETKDFSLDSTEEGETIYTTKPEFFGKAPPGKEIIIKLESENQISAKTSSSNDGVWRWSPPKPITPGAHKITITYKDENGVIRSIVRNFVVQAAESNEPAFESTPSANLTPTPRPTSTATPTTNPTSTNTAQTTIKTATPTLMPQPETGVKIPTLLLFSLGLLLFTVSGFLVLKN